MGLSLSYSPNATIKNNVFNNDGLSIEGDALSEYIHTIENNIVNGKPLRYYKNQKDFIASSNAGQIFIVNCTNVSVDGMTISNTSIGIEVAFSSGVNVTNSIIQHINWDAIRLLYSNNSNIRNNNISDIVCDGIWLWHSDYNNVYGNIINSTGIYLQDSSNNDITRNNISHPSSYSGNIGIYLYSSSNNNITENNISYSDDAGITIYWYSNNNVIQNNTIQLGFDGVRIMYYSDSNTIKHNNITDNDCDGVWLTGYYSGYMYALYYNSIENNTIYNNGCDGIHIYPWCYYTNITNNSIKDNRENGIQFWYYNDHYIIKNNVIMNNREDGIWNYYNFYIAIENNTITNNSYGIYNIYWSYDVAIENNTITNNSYGIYSEDGNKMVVYRNKFSNNAEYGIYNGGSIIIDAECNWWGDASGPGDKGPGSGDNVTLYVDYNPWYNTDELSTKTYYVSPTADYTSIQDGIDNASSGDTVAVGNGMYIENVVINKTITLKNASTPIINGNQSGSCITISADNVIVNGFELINGVYGIDISSFSNNIITNCTYAIYLEWGFEETEITNNTITDNQYGIYIYLGSNRHAIFRNNISYNGYYGIRIKGRDNQVFENVFFHNNLGMYLCCGSVNNIVYKNNFIQNKKNAKDDKYTNLWSYNSTGNYWDDYTGTDSDGDGIGDTPYQIPGYGNRKDDFPLIEPLQI